MANFFLVWDEGVSGTVSFHPMMIPVKPSISSMHHSWGGRISYLIFFWDHNFQLILLACCQGYLKTDLLGLRIGLMFQSAWLNIIFISTCILNEINWIRLINTMVLLVNSLFPIGLQINQSWWYISHTNYHTLAKVFDHSRISTKDRFLNKSYIWPLEHLVMLDLTEEKKRGRPCKVLRAKTQCQSSLELWGI